MPRPRTGLSSLRVPAIPIAIALIAALSLPMFLASPAPLSSDESLYLAEAHAIAWGEGFAYPSGEPVTHRAPLYPLVLAYGIALGGEDGAYAVSKAIIAVNAVLVAAIAWRLGGAVAGLTAGFAVSASAYLAGLGTTLYLDPLQSTFLLLALLALLSALREPRLEWFAFAGASTGLAFLAKESAVQWAPLGIAAWLGLRSLRNVEGARGGFVFTLAFAGVITPWWLWVYAQTSELFLLGTPSSLTTALMMAAALGFAMVSVAVARFREASSTTRATLRRFAPVACGVLVVAWSAFMLFGLTRYANWPYPDDYARTLPQYLISVAPQAQPYFLMLAAWGVVAWRAARGDDAMRLLGLAAMLFAPFAIFIANRGLQLRDALPLVYLSYVALGVAVAWLLERARANDDVPYGALAASVGLALAAMALAVHQHREFAARNDNAIAAEAGAADWDGPFAREIAAWMTENLPEGSRVVSSRLYFSSLYVHTDGRFAIRQLPTVRVDIDRDRQGLLAPASNLFRWEDTVMLPPSPADSWLSLRQYPGKGYWVGLRERELLAYLAVHETDFVVLTGDDGVFSSLQHASYFASHPAFTLVHAAGASPAERAFVYAVDLDALGRAEHATTISPHDAAALQRETGLTIEEIGAAIGTPLRVTDLERGLSSREAEAAVDVNLGAR